jgi:hypothetical protein
LTVASSGASHDGSEICRRSLDRHDRRWRGSCSGWGRHRLEARESSKDTRCIGLCLDSRGCLRRAQSWRSLSQTQGDEHTERRAARRSSRDNVWSKRLGQATRRGCTHAELTLSDRFSQLPFNLCKRRGRERVAALPNLDQTLYLCLVVRGSVLNSVINQRGQKFSNPLYS